MKRTIETQAGEPRVKRSQSRAKGRVALGGEMDVSLRVHSVLKAAGQAGMLGEKSHRIGGRISPALVEQAKKQTGIETDSELIEFALASIALDDHFGRVLREVEGTVSSDLKLGY